MPLYEYRCLACETRYEVLHLGAERIEEIVCPKCGSGRFTKLVSAPSIVSERGATAPCGERADACESGGGGCCGGGCDCG